MDPLLINLIIIALLIALNAFFAAAEIAIISVRETRIRPLAENGSKSARIVMGFLQDPSHFLATIQVGVTLAGFFASATAAAQLTGRLSALLRTLGVPAISRAANVISIVLITLAVSYVTLVFGELVPKRVALTRADRVATGVAWPVLWLSAVTYPFVWLLTASTNLILRILGIRPEEIAPAATEDELKMLIAQHAGLLEEEKEIIHEAFEFSDVLARQIMVPRPDIAAVRVDATISEALDEIKESGHPRLLIFRENLDDIVGVVHLKDLIDFIKAGQLDAPIADSIRPVIYVPETRRAIELLKDLQNSGLHIAVVVDEYGGTAGIITVEDVAEEVVGEFGGKTPEDELIISVSEHEIVVDGRLPIDELNEEFNLAVPESPEYETVAGWILAEFGRIPRPGEEVVHGDARFRVQSVKQNRIALVRIIRVPRKGPEESAGE